MLSQRERDVLQALADGMRPSAIAAALGISSHTVRYHLGRARTVLGARSSTHAVALALSRGYIR